MFEAIFEMMKDLITAWKEGDKKVRSAIVASGVLIATGASIAFLSNLLWQYPKSKLGENIAATIVASGALIAFVIVAVQKSKQEVRREKKIEAVERRVQENPGEPQAAWELARVKLESYLNRNLSQVRSIFWLTLLVMTGGFVLIGVGVYESFQNTTNFNASLLATGSGVIVSFIGGTFLVLYKATMAQAKDYVSILERINAVGMSVQILDTIDDKQSTLKHQTTAEVAKQLLTMYSGDLPINKSLQRTRRSRTTDA